MVDGHQGSMTHIKDQQTDRINWKGMRLQEANFGNS